MIERMYRVKCDHPMCDSEEMFYTEFKEHAFELSQGVGWKHTYSEQLLKSFCCMDCMEAYTTNENIVSLFEDTCCEHWREKKEIHDIKTLTKCPACHEEL